MSHSYTLTLSLWTAAHAAEHKQQQIHIQEVYVTGETLKEAESWDNPTETRSESHCNDN